MDECPPTHLIMGRGDVSQGIHIYTFMWYAVKYMPFKHLTSTTAKTASTSTSKGLYYAVLWAHSEKLRSYQK